jgi:uncharacterized protein YbjQ (UPF0145 family)
VYVTKAKLPTTVKYEVLGQIEAAKAWYGSDDWSLDELADGARKLGADAVVDVGIWHQPSGWAWSAPHGTGTAVKIISPAKVDFSGLEGGYR